MNNLKPYLPFGSQQVPWWFARIRNAWVALITAPNKISIEILDNIADTADTADTAERYTKEKQDGG